jgi:hypothetical protein
MLRVQQAIGPFYDLEMRDASLSGISPILNHRPEPGTTSMVLSPKHIYGRHTGMRYPVRYDENGIKLSSLRPNEGPPGRRILCMGDSFMEGFDDANTIPQHVYDHLTAAGVSEPKPVIFNAGFSSYSPAVFIPQAKALVPKLKPDFIVIDIDETNLGDDCFRYRHLLERDAEGAIVAVRPSPANVEFQRGLQQARSHVLYGVRLVHKVYHTRIHMPAFQRRYARVTDSEQVLNVAALAENTARTRYQQEINYYRGNLEELCATLVRLMGTPDRVLICRHPHLWHLKPDPKGVVWNQVSAKLIADVAAHHRIWFYDAEPDLKAAFGARPEDYYWANDMHFNLIGLKIYARLVARQVEILVESTRRR